MSDKTIPNAASIDADAHPITEADIAQFLINTPDFFERHAALLSAVQLSSGHGTRAVSLQERQAEMLREKIKSLERRMMDMVRNGNENVTIADRLQRWTRDLLLTQQAIDLPSVVTERIKSQFSVPQVAIKVWNVNGLFSDQEFAMGASEDAQTFAASLSTPYCGVNADFEAVKWLDQPELAMSTALIPLRVKADADTFGMLVLASPDAERFNASMGTDFLERIGELASAALSRLRA